MTIHELLQLMRKRLPLVIALPLILAVLMAGYKYAGSSHSYTATTRAYVSRSQIYESGEGDSMVAFAQATINDVSMLYNSDGAWQAALDATGLENGEMLGYTVVPTIEVNTNIIRLDVTGPDAKMAADIANAITNYVATNASDIMSTDAVTVLGSAYEESVEAMESVSKKSLVKYGLVGFVGGLFLAVVILILQDMFDNRVRSVDEAAALTGLPVIGRFPVER